MRKRLLKKFNCKTKVKEDANFDHFFKITSKYLATKKIHNKVESDLITSMLDATVDGFSSRMLRKNNVKRIDALKFNSFCITMRCY